MNDYLIDDYDPGWIAESDAEDDGRQWEQDQQTRYWDNFPTSTCNESEVPA